MLKSANFSVVLLGSGVPLLHMHIGIRQHPEPGVLIAAALENPPCEQESGV